MSIAIKHANGLPAGVFKVQPLIRETAMTFQAMHHLFNLTAPLLQQSIKDLANLHFGDVPPPSRLGVGKSVEARMMLALPEKLQSQMRLRLAQMDTAQVISEIRAYKIDPPVDVYKVCRGVLVLLGHGRWAGAELELQDWDDVRPKMTRSLFKDMQAISAV